MITRTVRIQLVIFTVLTLGACSLIFFHYARVPDALGYEKIKITAVFDHGSGIYPDANVTYRSVKIGRVTDVRLTDSGHAAVDMRIDTSYGVPANAGAKINSMSPIGEQYVDLVGSSGGTDTLSDGAVIPAERTTLPKEIAPVLDQVNEMLATVPREDMDTVLAEFERGLHGVGPDLGKLLTEGDALLAEAEKHYGSTSELLRALRPVLDSQRGTAGSIASWPRDWRAFSAMLRKHDADLRKSMRNVTGAAGEGEGLLKDLDPNMLTLLGSVNTLADLGRSYNKPLEQVFVVYPKIAAANIAQSGPLQGGNASLFIKTNVNRPAPCQIGWVPPGQPGGARPSHDLSDELLPENSYCKAPQNDPRAVRGARNLECFEPSSPPGRRAATIEQCRGEGFENKPPNKQYAGVDSPIHLELEDPLSILTSTGKPSSTPKEKTWQSLLSEMIGK